MLYEENYWLPRVAGDNDTIVLDSQKTTAAFELALLVIFLSGVQHFGETPRGLDRMPGYIKDFLRELPASWDDVKLIHGYPGQYAVIARKHGNKWYIAGINRQDKERVVKINLSALGKEPAVLIKGEGEGYFSRSELSPAGTVELKLKPRGGFVIKL